MSLILLLFVIGLFLLAVEVLVPGGILGIAGGVSLLAGCVVAFVELGTPGGLAALALALFLILGVFFIELRLLPRTRVGKRFFLRREITGHAAALKENTRDLIGKTARSVTVLSPSGYVDVAGTRFEAVSQSGQIEAGIDLEIVDASPFQLTVRTKH